MSLEKYSRRFVKHTNSDLLVIYHRVSDKASNAVYLDWHDVKTICELITKHRTQSNNDLTIMIQTQGGIFQCAIGLVETFRKLYTNNISSVVMNISKSSGAFIAQSACHSYMHQDAVISDFSMGHNIAINAQKTIDYMNTALNLFLKKSTVKTIQDSLQKFQALITSKIHAQNINFATANQKFGVNDINTFTPPNATWHMKEIHNFLLYEFGEKSGIDTIIGLNGEYVFS